MKNWCQLQKLTNVLSSLNARKRKKIKGILESQGMDNGQAASGVQKA